MKLLRSTKSENGEYFRNFEINDVVLLNCNIVTNNYLQN